MLYREIIAVCTQIHIKHINTVCGQNAEFAVGYIQWPVCCTDPTLVTAQERSQLIQALCYAVCAWQQQVLQRPACCTDRHVLAYTDSTDSKRKTAVVLSLDNGCR